MMAEATVAQTAPYPMDVKGGETYWWCSCGQSANQPFCDGSHAGTDFTPLSWTAEEDGTAWFCGCKHTKATPMCDGSHSAL